MDSDKATQDGQSDSMGVTKILGLIPMFLLFIVIILRVSWVLYRSTKRQKTRNTQQRRVFVGSRQRQLSVQGEPTIFVSPTNLPPPPKYEVMAPPSYDEVMRVYPVYPVGQQPITQPLVHALAQSTPATSNSETSPNSVTINVTNNVSRRPNETATVTVTSSDTPAVVTVTAEERRTSVAARA